MSIILSNIYHDTARTYQLSLVAGADGLQNVMSWVYITEDIENTGFLRGGELIITTGILGKSDPSWLLSFAKEMYGAGACGLVVNIGKYITDLPEELIAFCDNNSFPLFTLPWAVHLYSISKDYYERLFIERQSKLEVSTSISALLNNLHVKENVLNLEKHHFAADDEYVITTVTVSEIKFSSSQLLFFFENAIASFRIKCHCQLHKSDIILVFKGENWDRINEFIFHLENHMNLYSSGKFYIGIGSTVALNSLAKSFFHSSAAILMAKTLDRKHISYEELGFYRVLFSSTDTDLFEKFIDEQLGKIVLYDEKHNSNYLQTLRSYLFNGGSLKAMTEELFCHRNTINYRVHVLKDTFNLELDDAICRFHLMAAFYIQDFIDIINAK